MSESTCNKCGENHPPESACTNPIGKLIGTAIDDRYLVESVLGKGGMGVVFKATQKSVGRPVAVKMLHPSLADTPAFFDRFKREAELASRLHHPNIITIYDFGRSKDGGCYYVMELLEGDSLRQLVRAEGPLPIARAVRIIEQIGRALANAHSQHVIHRDLKPHNVMVSQVDGQDYCKVLDFGLVKMLEGEDKEENQLTTTGQVLGTPTYMAPEQAAGDPVDQRADLYALGVTLFYCLTGSTPFKTNSAQKALLFLMSNELPKVNDLRVGAPIPEALQQFIVRAMAFEADGRPASAEQFIAEMKAALDGVPEAELNARPTGKNDAPDISNTPSKISKVGRDNPTVAQRTGGSRSQGGVVVNKEALQASPPPKPGAKGGATPLVLGVGIAVVVAAGGIGFFAPRGSDQPATPVQVVAKPVEQPPVVARPADPPPKPTTATVQIASTPAGASVFRGETLLGVTPAQLVVPREAVNFTLRLDGYQPLTQGVDLTASPEGQPTVVNVTLVAVPKAAPEEKKPAKKKGPDIPTFGD